MTETAPARPFVLDRFQREAIEALDTGHSVLVAAPTGSGKTVLAEHAIELALASGKKAFYTAPIKALSNQKFVDLSRMFGAARVGLLTGDNAIRGDAPVVVMTTEVLRNMIYARSPTLRDLQFVVLDEVHYLQDAYRGPVWEEVIIHAPPSVRLVCLSATISNADELASWITTVRGSTATIVETRRPVELQNHYLVGDRLANGLQQIPTLIRGRPNERGSSFDSDSIRAPRSYRGRPRRRFRAPRRVEVVEHLADADWLPAIYFVFSRNGCDDAARSVVEAGVRLTRSAERSRIRAIAEERTASLTDADLDVLDYDRWLAALELGIAAHHAGMVPAFKEAVEACFVEGLVKVVFATETLALGINMPARSVVIESLSKFNGDHHEFLTPAEYTQLTGRAGRRGIDEVGHAVVLWSPFVPFDQVAALASSRRFSLTSAFRPNYNMAANLVRRYRRDEAHGLLNRSFAQYQADAAVMRLDARRAELEERLATFEADARCERGDVEEYRALLAEEDAERSRGNGRGHVEDALGRLRPGDILRASAPHGRLAVLGVGFRRSGNFRVRTVTTQGRMRNLGTPDFDNAPDVIGTIELPSPFRPDDRGYQRDVAELLRRARVRAGRRRGGGRGPGGPYGGKGRGQRHRPPAHHRGPDSSAADQHPVASCPDRGRHLRAAARADQVRREIADVDRRIATHTESLSVRFDRVLEVLELGDFVEGWTLTARGRVLAGLYHECDLLVADAVYDGVLDGLDEAELAALVSCFTYEHRSKFPAPAPRFPSSLVRERFDAIAAAGRRLTATERRLGLTETREPDASFVDLAHAWATGAPLDHLLGDEDLSPGDFVRNMKQLVDLLRQIAELAPVAETRAVAREGAGTLLRGVVAAATAVGEGPGLPVDDDVDAASEDTG